MELTGLKAIREVSYTHDAMIDLLIAKPFVSQGQVAAHFGYTQAWVSRIIRSDAFRERFAVRKSELSDPLLIRSIEDKFQSLVDRSLEILMEKLDQPVVQADLALKAAELGAKALGLTERNRTAQVNNTFVVAMPDKCQSAQEWIAQHSPRAPIEVGSGPPLAAEPRAAGPSGPSLELSEPRAGDV